MSADSPAIDAYDLDANDLYVRGQRLLDIAMLHTYADAVLFAITGKLFPHDTIVRLLEHAKTIADQYYSFSSRVASPLSTSEQIISVMACSILEDSHRLNAEPLRSPQRELLSDDEWMGLVLFHAIAAAIPSYLCASKTNADADNLSWRDLSYYSRDLLIAFAPLDQSDSKTSFRADPLMISLIGGFGVVAPTTALARFSAGTRAPFEWSLVASAMGCGPAHIGACSLAMHRLIHAGLNTDNLDEIITQYCKQKPFPGFGHPIMPVDPRAAFLFDTYQDIATVRKARSLADSVTAVYSLHPNIDFVAAAILVAWGLSPAAGSLFFWFCRLPIIIAHICEKHTKPPFGVSSSEAREKYRSLKTGWV
jgi:citrate synthase